MASLLENIFCGRPIKQAIDLASENMRVTTSLKAAYSSAASLSSDKEELQKELESCKKNMTAGQQEFQNQIVDLTGRNTNLTTQITQLQAQVDSLKKPFGPTNAASSLPYDSVFSMLPQASRDAALACWNKYDEVDAVYTARYLGTNPSNTYPIDVKAFALEGQNDFKMQAAVKKSDAYVLSIMQEFPTINSHQACDISTMRIASTFMKTYIGDSSEWGRSEYWAFASEVNADECKGDDCDGMGVWKYVAYRVAGIPESLLRCTAGQTQSGLGHFTNHYMASDLSWRHVNSTMKQSSSSTIFDCPKTNDPNDELGIKFVWFSFCDSRCFAQYQTDAAKESVDVANQEHAFMKNIRIMPKGTRG